MMKLHLNYQFERTLALIITWKQLRRSTKALSAVSYVVLNFVGIFFILFKANKSETKNFYAFVKFVYIYTRSQTTFEDIYRAYIERETMYCTGTEERCKNINSHPLIQNTLIKPIPQFATIPNHRTAITRTRSSRLFWSPP